VLSFSLFCFLSFGFGLVVVDEEGEWGPLYAILDVMKGAYAEKYNQ
jgi:hypothetical protein